MSGSPTGAASGGARRSRRPDRPFDGAVAIVTGAAGGIGRAVSLGLAARGAKAVVVTYASSGEKAAELASELEAAGCAARALKVDVRNEDEVVAMVEATLAEFGAIDILVNNAGATAIVPFADLDGITDEMWETVLGINVRGAFTVTRAAAAGLRASRGSVVNVASISGHRAIGSSIAYGVSKAAVIQLTRGLASALAPEVRVNSVSPGTVASDWLGNLIGRDAAATAHAADAANNPMGRVAQPEDVADMVFGLLASDYVTGQDVIVDGGKHLRY